MIRAAITLKLCTYEDTGAMVAALTTSIPEARRQRSQLGLSLLLAARRVFLHPGAEPARRDADHGGLSALHRPHRRRAATARASQPLFGLSATTSLTERDRAGARRAIAAWGRCGSATRPIVQRQHDVYGAAILACAQLFFDQRLTHARRRGALRAARVVSASTPAARVRPARRGPWEFRGAAAVHTFSAAMCWAACDRLAQIAAARSA